MEVQNIYDRKADWGAGAILMPRRFSAFNTSYELPFGHGKALGNNWNPLINGILGNWRLGAIVSAHTGFPITVTALDHSGTLSAGVRANCVGNPSGLQEVDGGHLVQYQSVRAAIGRHVRQLRRRDNEWAGAQGFGYVHCEGISDPGDDAARFRTEFFNTTNTPIFLAPNTNVNAARFGEITGAEGEKNISSR